jgi:hypothetical protein
VEQEHVWDAVKQLMILIKKICTEDPNCLSFGRKIVLVSVYEVAYGYAKCRKLC